MNRGKLRRFFPGNNTCEGFFSYYHNIIKPDARRVFILKGGPGVGKSIFMKKIADNLLARGFDLELHHCSSDKDSLDAVVIPLLKVALLDGTSPHLADPQNPGAVDEIVYLGEYWDANVLVARKKEIIALNKRIARLFKTVYSYFKEAKVAQDELNSYFGEGVKVGLLRQSIRSLCTGIFKDVSPDYQKEPDLRRLFASANTPHGLVNYLETILQDARKLYILRGEAAAGREELMQKILDEGLQLGLTVEAYHCPFEPGQLELLYFPQLFRAILYQNDRLDFETDGLDKLEDLEILDLNRHLEEAVCAVYEEEIADAKKRLSDNIARAYQKLYEAKKAHDELERLYRPAMDFKAVEKRREEILKCILFYAEEFEK